MYVPKPRLKTDEAARVEILSPASSHVPATKEGVDSTLSMEKAEGGGAIRTLLVDPDVHGRALVQADLEAEGYQVTAVSTGVEARSMLAATPYDILLCETRLPDETGFDLLTLALQTFPEMPVILLSAHGGVEQARAALHAGASDFVTKPCPRNELPVVVERNLTRQTLLRKSALRQKLALQTSNESVLDALLTALNSRHMEIQGHSERVTAYTMELADRMDLSHQERYAIERGALLHDIGTIGIPDRILFKPGKLSQEELVEMREHPMIGYRMCVRIPMLQGAALIVRHHHEAWDGSGYPDGLKADQIPLGARIVALVDAFDAMTSDRPYRAALAQEAACAEIRAKRGIQFDPEIADLLLAIPEARWRYLHALSLP